MMCICFVLFLCSTSDLDEIVESLMTEENNSEFKLVQADSRNGLIIIRYEILNSHVRIIMSFKKAISLSASSSTLGSHLPYNHSRNTLESRPYSAISFDNLTLDG